MEAVKARKSLSGLLFLFALVFSHLAVHNMLESPVTHLMKAVQKACFWTEKRPTMSEYQKLALHCLVESVFRSAGMMYSKSLDTSRVKMEVSNRK